MRYWIVVFAATLAACGGSGSSPLAQPIVEDTTPPVITLTGDNPQLIEAGEAYTELGATATDNVDGDLSAAIVINTSTVDTTEPGDYAVTYDVTDAAGNAASTVTRTVRVQNPPLPAAPTASVEGDIKQLIFSWDAIAGAEFYRLLENADGHSGFTQVGDDIPAGTLTATRDIAVHLFDWVEAQYLVEACNIGGCNSSTVVTATDVMLDTIGYFKASNTDKDDSFAMVAMSADGTTLVVGAPAEDSGATSVNGDQTDNSIRNSGAVYVFRLSATGWYQQAYVKASNTNQWDGFGGSIALSVDGNTLAVGAPGEDSGATGVNGDQTDNSASAAGAVYLFRSDGQTWSQQAYIKASNTDSEDEFGGSIALSADGNTLAVGAAGEDSSSIGINGDQYNDGCECGSSGAVYVFRFDDSEWSQQAYIKASNTGVGTWWRENYGFYFYGDRFGAAVTLSGDGNSLAVGAPYEDSGATGINGNEADDLSIECDSGAVYTFSFDGADWSQQNYIKPSFAPDCTVEGFPEPGYGFGNSIVLSSSGTVLAVAGVADHSSAIGVNDPPLSIDGQANHSGAVHLFRSNGTSWLQEAYIKASNTDSSDYFGGYPEIGGTSIALSAEGSTIAIGAPGEASATTGINRDQADNSAPAAGAVYLLTYDGQTWSQKAYVKASNTDPGDGFGGSVVLSGGGYALAVGAHFEDSTATGINGNEFEDVDFGSSGAVYVY